MPRWYARRSPASLTTSSPSRRSSSRSGSSTGGSSISTAARRSAGIRRTDWVCPPATSPASPTACCTRDAGATGRSSRSGSWTRPAPLRTTSALPRLRWKLNPQTFTLGWELPALRGDGIPADARYKPGSGGQLVAFVPSLDLVITRQTGSSGEWAYEEYVAPSQCNGVAGSGRKWEVIQVRINSCGPLVILSVAKDLGCEGVKPYFGGQILRLRLRMTDSIARTNFSESV